MTKQGKMLYGGLASLERELARAEWQGARYTIIVDENTFQHCLPRLIGSVEALSEADFVEVPVGEECKSVEVAAQVWQTLLEGEADRNRVILTLGGGAVCDLGGFIAATYKRGLRLIHVPTSLLAMADAAIGGKTAVDFGGVKNSVGCFYPANVTVIEHAFLQTLDQQEVLNGAVEMVKTAAVADPELYGELLQADGIDKAAVQRVARIKAKVVQSDPYDHGIRRILNFGHTFGHAIEVHLALPHGVSVGLGMHAAMYLSMRKVGLPGEVYRAYSKWLSSKVQAPRFTLSDIEQMLPLMRQDKKCADGALQCVLLRELGAAMIDVEVSDNEVRDAMLQWAHT